MFLGATWAKQKYKLKHTTDSSAVSVVVYYSLVFLGDLGKEKISTKAQHSALPLLLGGAYILDGTHILDGAGAYIWIKFSVNE